MKINFDQVLKNYDGKDFEETVDGVVKKITLSGVSVNALLANIEGERIEGMEKLNRDKIARKVHKGGEVELTVEETAKIKEMIGKAFPTIVVGATYELLEGETK